MKGYYNSYSYMGYIDGEYMEFATDSEYEEYVEVLENG